MNPTSVRPTFAAVRRCECSARKKSASIDIHCTSCPQRLDVHETGSTPLSMGGSLGVIVVEDFSD